MLALLNRLSKIPIRRCSDQLFNFIELNHQSFVVYERLHVLTELITTKSVLSTLPIKWEQTLFNTSEDQRSLGTG